MTFFSRCFSLLLIGAWFSATAAAAVPYFVDGDGDGIADEVDDCPYTHPGAQVAASGCPLRSDDADVDGVPDDTDNCPYSPAGAVIDAYGCSVDSDFDGVADGIDRCLDTSLALPVDDRGCARGEHAAAGPAQRTAAVRSRAAPASIRNVSPAAAKTPTQAIATPAQGSVAATGSVAESPLMQLRFAPNSSRLGTDDLVAIDGYARIFARRLAQNPASKLHLEAFADRREADVAVLAVARMVRVRDALVAKGIAKDRIRAENALLDGGDARRNRRVEARLEN